MKLPAPLAWIAALVILVLGLSLFTGEQNPAAGGQIHVAIASNFTPAGEALARRFEAQSGISVVLSFGSTGKLYAQVKNGAPYEVFLAADSERPQRLEQEQAAISGSRFTYALGKIVLWSPRAGLVDDAGQVLEDGDFQHLSLANPVLAPYGAAARATLQARGLWDLLQPRVVMGENIAQAFLFVESGNAELGFVALSQVIALGPAAAGSSWQVPQSLYPPIAQQAVLIKNNEAARAFMEFMRSETARGIIRDYGYGTP